QQQKQNQGADPTTPTTSSANGTPNPNATVRTFLNTDNSNLALPASTTMLGTGEYAAAWIVACVLSFLAATQDALARRLFALTPSHCPRSPQPSPAASATSLIEPPNGNRKFRSFISTSTTSSDVEALKHSARRRRTMVRIVRTVLYGVYKAVVATALAAIVVLAGTLNVGLLCAIIVGAGIGAAVVEWTTLPAKRRGQRRSADGSVIDERPDSGGSYPPYLIGG
ncbi:hypothetical protein HKX48_005404, partial [Thoreauomyces humboldtii]